LCYDREQLLEYRGRCRFIQYIPSKPCQYGIKIFWICGICDASNSYAIDGLIYCGRQLEEGIKKRLESHIVKTLSKSIRKSGRNITMDNFFTSIELAEEMLYLSTVIVGTLGKINAKFQQAEKKLSSIHNFSQKYDNG
jgi:hypothetical protein